MVIIAFNVNMSTWLDTISSQAIDIKEILGMIFWNPWFEAWEFLNFLFNSSSDVFNQIPYNEDLILLLSLLLNVKSQKTLNDHSIKLRPLSHNL